MTTPELTPDLIEEIMCRVPAADLFQMRPTCKRWNRLIKEDKRFQTKHFEKLSVLVQLDEIESKTEIWVTNKIDESTKVVSWSKVLVLDLSDDLQLSNEGSFLLDEEKKEVMCCEKYIDEFDETKSKDMLYIVGEDSKVRPVELGLDVDDVFCLPSILNYFPSLVRIKPAGRKRKRGD